MDISSDSIRATSAPLCAYISYCPETKVSEEEIYYNQETECIFSPPSSKEGTNPFSDISSLCSKWKGLLDRRQDELKTSGEGGNPKEVLIIDTLQSWQRRYTVMGVILSNHPSNSKKQGGQYLFILNRFSPDNVNLPWICRQWGLNKREQEIVRLLIADCSNKEIAQKLGLKLNTVKGYMKLLMRRLGVNSRTGIVATVLTKKLP